MAEVFKIVSDPFVLKVPRYVLYEILIPKGAVLHVNDVLVDLHGNRLEIKGFPMICRGIEGRKRLEELNDDPEYYSYVVDVYSDAKEFKGLQGEYLIRENDCVNFLFCNNPLDSKEVDEDYEEEYKAARLEHPCALFSYEDLQEGKLSLYGEDITGLTVYRGWMMKPEMYRNLYDSLKSKRIILVNTPDEYERYHMLPGWYEDFKNETVESFWTDSCRIDDIKKMAKDLNGSFIVKDYVKSRKHEWYDACFIPDITKESELERIVGNFIKRQGDDLVGGVVLRQFVNLKKKGFHKQSGMPISEEYRIFIYAGKVIAIDDYWTDNHKVNISEKEHKWIESVATRLKSNFVTMDVGRKEDGSLIIMEFGDGQVSGLQQLDPKVFYKEFTDGNTKLGDIPIEDILSKDIVVLAGDPMPDVSVEDMRQKISGIENTQDLVDAYVNVHNKFWYIEDDLYDYEEGTKEYERVYSVVTEWCEMMHELDEKIMEQASAEGLLSERQPDSGTAKQLEAFMDKYGYRDGGGWWVKKKKRDKKSIKEHKE